jgi:DNA-binding XRE family transcriptional regulator
MIEMATCKLHQRFIDRVRERRIELGLTQAEAGKLLGWNQSAWSHIENGRSDPSCKTMSSIAEALGIEVEDLLAKDAAVPA